MSSSTSAPAGASSMSASASALHPSTSAPTSRSYFETQRAVLLGEIEMVSPPPHPAARLKNATDCERRRNQGVENGHDWKETKEGEGEEAGPLMMVCRANRA
jgi:hypothetical protein